MSRGIRDGDASILVIEPREIQEQSLLSRHVSLSKLSSRTIDCPMNTAFGSPRSHRSMTWYRTGAAYGIVAFEGQTSREAIGGDRKGVLLLDSGGLVSSGLVVIARGSAYDPRGIVLPLGETMSRVGPFCVHGLETGEPAFGTFRFRCRRENASGGRPARGRFRE